MNNSNLGGILKERRKAMNLTLKEASQRSGVSPSHLSRIEQGKRFPSGHILRKLAEPLGFTEVELLKLAGFLSGHILRKLAEPLGFTEVELLKLAGFLSGDDSEDKLARFKEEIKRDIADALVNLHRKIDSWRAT